MKFNASEGRYDVKQSKFDQDLREQAGEVERRQQAMIRAARQADLSRRYVGAGWFRVETPEALEANGRMAKLLRAYNNRPKTKAPSAPSRPQYAAPASPAAEAWKRRTYGADYDKRAELPISGRSTAREERGRTAR